MPFSKKLEEELEVVAQQWALQNGLSFRRKVGKEWVVERAPFALVPSYWPLELYQEALKLQPIFNKLINAIVKQREWLGQICKKLATGDDFVKRLYEIWEECPPPPTPTLYLGVFRSDYMLNKGEEGGLLELKQVEINTIAASFAHLSTITTRFHQEYYKDMAVKIPSNEASTGIGMAIRKAMELFNARYNLEESCSIMVVHPEETNYFDQIGIINNVGLKMYRRTFSELSLQCKMGISDDGHLYLFNPPSPSPLVVSVVYFRVGYSPLDYDGEECWRVRSLLEQSNAIKVPDIATHLAGLKKIQQELTKPEVLEMFLDDDEEIKLVTRTFMKISSLDQDAEGDMNVVEALKDPEKWVIKPQREGGGNNIYGSKIVPFLESVPPSIRATHILMSLINAPIEVGSILLCQKVWKGETVSELGIFGIILVDGFEIKENCSTGYLVRTKPSSSKEGGVASGYACLNTLCLQS